MHLGRKFYLDFVFSVEATRRKSTEKTLQIVYDSKLSN